VTVPYCPTCGSEDRTCDECLRTVLERLGREALRLRDDATRAPTDLRAYLKGKADGIDHALKKIRTVLE